MTRLFLAIAGAVTLLGGCATTGEESTSSKQAFLDELQKDPRVGDEVDSICFTGNIDGFGETTDRSVVVSVSPTRDYVITTFTRCNLNTNIIKISDSSHQLSVMIGINRFIFMMFSICDYQQK